MNKLFLLDGHALIYRAYYAFIRNPRFNSQGLNTSAIFGFLLALDEVIKKEKPTHIAVALDPKGKTFRHEMYEPYKANRDATPEDIKLAIPYIIKLIEGYNIPVLQIPHYEADDVIGTVAKQAEKEGFEVFMMTPDKDYAQLTSDHIFMYKPRFGRSGFDVLGEKEVCEKYDLENANQVIDMLGLMGDSADNIPGCPRVGEKTAIKLLKKFGSIEKLLVSTEELKGAQKKAVEENIEQIKLSKDLATIRLDVPITFDAEEYIFQTPNMEALTPIFLELDFRSFLNKMTDTVYYEDGGNQSKANKAPETKAPKKAPTASAMEPSLFDEMEQNESNSGDLFQTYLTSNANYTLVNDTQQIEALVTQLLSSKLLCIDTETTSLEVMQAEIVGLSLCVEAKTAYYIPFSKNKEEALERLNHLKPLFENPESLKIGQNLKYDLGILANYDIEVKGPLFDTMVAHYLLQPDARHNMDYLAETLLNYRCIPITDILGAKGKKQLNMRDISPELVTNYAAEDADITFQLYKHLSQKLEKEKLTHLFETIEMPLLRVLLLMERNGVLIDDFALGQSSDTMTAQMQKIERHIRQLADDSNINVSSPKQIGELLFDKLKITDKAKKTKTGQYVTDEETLQKLKTKSPIVEEILEFRGLKKLLSTYIDALPRLIHPQTGRVHTSFNQTVAATGRLSSSNPNLQNIPIRDESSRDIRRAFIAEKGCKFVSADYSQVELRLMAHLSQDPHLVEAFKLGQDIHAATAAKIYKVDLSEVTSDMRRKAKTANFGIIYGISVFGLSERLNIPRGEAKELIEGYFENYPAVKEYMDSCIAKATENGYVETLYDRKRYLPDIHSRNRNVRGYAERNAINTPIQGTAADIIKIAMINIAKRMKKEELKSKMLIQVHDELNFNVPNNELETMQTLIREEMENAAQLTVPLRVDIGVADNWLDAH